MALGNLFKPSPEKLANIISDEVSINSSYETNQIRQILINFVINVSNEEISQIYLEILFVKIHILDKLLSNYRKNEFRSNFINMLINGVKTNFINSQSLSGFYNDSGSFFENYFQKAFYSYPPSVPIISDTSEMDSAMHFVERILSRYSIESEGKKNLMSTLMYDTSVSFIERLIASKNIKRLMK